MDIYWTRVRVIFLRKVVGRAKVVGNEDVIPEGEIH